MSSQTQDPGREEREAEHFTQLYEGTGHTWWGNLTKAGQRRNDRRIELLTERIFIKPDTSILEVGCGKGEYTRRLATLGCPITAIDVTPVLIQTARQNIPSQNITFEVMDATAPDFPSSSFDVIFGKSILHHLDYAKALAAYLDLLKPGGWLFFSEPNIANPLNLLGLKISPLRKVMEFSDDEIAFRRDQLLDLATRLGYTSVSVEYFDFLFPRIPDSLIDPVDRAGRFLEKVPVLKAMSGSLLLTARRQH